MYGLSLLRKACAPAANRADHGPNDPPGRRHTKAERVVLLAQDSAGYRSLKKPYLFGGINRATGYNATPRITGLETLQENSGRLICIGGGDGEPSWNRRCGRVIKPRLDAWPDAWPASLAMASTSRRNCTTPPTYGGRSGT